jgi:precorrin isomerase
MNMASPHDYLRRPDEIYRRSFALIRAEAKLDHLPADIAGVAVRLIHACGMTDIVADLAFDPAVAMAARVALGAGAAICCDARMVAAGVMAGLLPARNEIVCTIDEARAEGSTRSSAAVDLWGERLAGAVVAIGNAPTALYRLLEVIEAGGPRPAAIFAFPVGFVGAAESKAALVEARTGVPYLTLLGRRGGSALAAAALNALVVAEGE